MKVKKYMLLTVLVIQIVSCSRHIINKNQQTALPKQTYEGDYLSTISPDGKIEAAVLMHSRMGIRMEMNLNKHQLDLWISPQAGKSTDNRLRNFSCRDDHTSIFDKISFPELGRKQFIRCDYDPFHSVLYFEGQTMHLASLLDEPSILVWFEKGEVVDIKSDQQDSLLIQSPNLFGTRHPDRGLVLDFYAALGGKEAVFQHQPEVQNHRSIYARSIMMPGQFMVLSGELVTENIKKKVEEIASTDLNKLLAANEVKIKAATKPGSIQIKNLPELQKLYEVNQRHVLSVQDASGAIHAALKYVYYLIWATDGTVTSSSMMQTGNSKFLKLWCEYLLANPTNQSTPPAGPFYGQLVNEKITKREEFGALCAVWPSFMYWGLTGDDQFVSGKNKQLLIDVVDWLDRYCYDSSMQAIGTYYIGGGSEDPFWGSNDFGFDAAVGSFMNRNPSPPQYAGDTILRAYEFNMNLNQYNMYLMLSSVTSGNQSKKYIEQAHTIERFLNKLDSLNASAIYLLKNKGMITIPRTPGETEKGLFAIQHNAPACYMPNFSKYFMNRMTSFKSFTTESIKHQYACDVYGRLAGLDIEFMAEQKIVESLLATLQYNIQPSRFIPMPYSMVEVFGAESGTYHDIRPQAFSTGPFQAAVANLAVRTMPFGIALRGSNYLKEITDFEYLHSNLNIYFEGKGQISTVTLNNAELSYTLQIPDKKLQTGNNKIEIKLSDHPDKSPCLVYSTVRLNEVEKTNTGIVYNIAGYSQNVLIFKNTTGNIRILDTDNKEVKYTTKREEDYLFIEFFGKDAYKVIVAE